MVNAAIIPAEGEDLNVPWLVELALPVDDGAKTVRGVKRKAEDDLENGDAKAGKR